MNEIENFLKEHPEAYPSPVYLTGKIGGKEILIRAKEGEIKIEENENIGQKETIELKFGSKEVILNGTKPEGDSFNPESFSVDEGTKRERGCGSDLQGVRDSSVSILQMAQESDPIVRGRFIGSEERSAEEGRIEGSERNAGEISTINPAESDNSKRVEQTKQGEDEVREHDSNGKEDNFISCGSRDITQGVAQ
jgi:hypothetical protein